MIANATVEALERIASRAEDLRDAYRSGAIPRHPDARTAGASAPSTDPLAAVAPPGAWFVAAAPDGTPFYTRDGGFAVRDGAVTTAGGAPVLGYAADRRDAPPAPLRVPDADRALGRAATLRVEPDGTLAYARAAIEPRTGERRVERVVLGRIALARFPAGTAPVRLDGVRFAAPPGVAPHLGRPADDAFPALATGRRDTGALDLETGLARLNDAYVAFEALAAAHRARGDVERTTLDLVK